ncbi:MAG: sacsin N-terminal ATP-binding-like domain-containing protein [Erythrobacter sp.]|uniref:sacsin N-terminal ATP-binding-like domain-containing protein n=1 Tax=Erythrobacter sp. TaxID=1042 RepID=UPI003A88381B
MTVIDEIRARRQKLADVLESKEYSGIRLIVEELYPDQAHFLFELLQNAQDTGATEAVFTLSSEKLIFEHNGRPFDRGDIEGITNIGKGTKASDEEAIGRFGVGFKAVFAYSETPRIFSPTFSFRIESLVLPIEIKGAPNLGSKTRFEFPFNNPKKPADRAFAEIQEGLTGLSETSLLFLSNLESVGWEIEGAEKGEVLRLRHSTHHIEILRQVGGEATNSSHFLRFDQEIEELKNQSVSVAFPLRFLAENASFEEAKPLAKQMRILPAEIGQVSVFFPAEKETSGLRFHLHAPFVPELSRASVKETPTNEPLFSQLARLCANSLHKIRDLGLLNAETLGVLPNKQDAIPKRYEEIRKAIINEFNNEALTPTYDRSHAPAKTLFQSKAAIKSVISEHDLSVLVGLEVEPKWAANAPQKNSNADRMLSSLEIRDWDVDDLVNVLGELEGGYWQEPNDEVKDWLSSKSDEWLQQLYSFLYRQLGEESGFYDIEDCPIVRLHDGTFAKGKGCYFPSDDDQEDGFSIVRADLYQSGKSKSQQLNARKFLEEIGVKEIDEKELVRAILNERYSRGSIDPNPKDFMRFVKLVEADSSAATIFRDAHIFEIPDGRWARPGSIFLDDPFAETGLRAFFGDQCKNEPFPLADRYAQDKISSSRLAKFAKALGAITEIRPVKVTVDNHPQRDELKADYYQYGVRKTHTGIDEDYVLRGLKNALKEIDVEKAKVIWSTMSASPSNVLKARFRPNRQYNTRLMPSTLVHQLKNAKWVPQSDGQFTKPCDARADLLPSGFPYDVGKEWLAAVGFGTEAEKRTELAKKRKAIAEELGFEDEVALADARKFAGLAPEERRAFFEEIERKASLELPENEPRNPSRRAEKVGELAATATERKTEMRTRSVSIGREDVKNEAGQYLRQQYTNDGELFCQVCKLPMPFRLDDGNAYFERVEFLPSLQKRYHQNYLALCPTDAAKFRFANGTDDMLLDLFCDLDSEELEVILAQNDETIYFTKTHLADLKKVIEVDRRSSTDNPQTDGGA